MAEEENLPAPKPADEPEGENKELPLEDERREPADLPPDVSIKPARTGTWTRLIAVTLVLILLLAIAAGIYWFFLRKPAASNSGNNQPTGQSAANQQAAQAPAAVITTATKHYDSTNQSLGFDYPADWTVKESTSVITATSPTMQLTDAGGQNISGQVVLTIRQKGQPLPEFDSGNAVAVLASQKIAYTNPTQAQRGHTYVTFAHYANSPAGSLDALYVTGDFGYKVGQAVPKTDVAKLDPLLTISFKKCSDNNCTSTTPAGISTAVWDNSSFSGPLLTMLKSLSVS